VITATLSARDILQGSRKFFFMQTGRTLFSVNLEVTRRCNMRCDFWDYWKETGRETRAEGSVCWIGWRGCCRKSTFTWSEASKAISSGLAAQRYFLAHHTWQQCAGSIFEVLKPDLAPRDTLFPSESCITPWDTREIK